MMCFDRSMDPLTLLAAAAAAVAAVVVLSKTLRHIFLIDSKEKCYPEEKC